MDRRTSPARGRRLHGEGIASASQLAVDRGPGTREYHVGLGGMFLSVRAAGAAILGVLANSQALLVAPFARSCSTRR